MKYEKAREYLKEIGTRGIVPGLESIKELCKRLGNPQKELQFVHIAGTNGKGSIHTYISSVLKKAGYRTGGYISPALRDYREIIQVNGSLITKKAVGELVEQIKEICDGMVADGLPHPTVFEIETAMAFLYFKQEKCEIVVLETGLGGLLDATNIISAPLVAVFASISMDHMAILGDTLEKIARQKAGIIKSGCSVVTGAQEPEVSAVLKEEATARDCEFCQASLEAVSKIRYGITKQQFHYKQYRNLQITLAGKCQIDNCITAIEALHCLQEKGFSISDKALYDGLKEAKWVGRFSVVEKRPLFVIDGAHNADAAKKLADSIRFYFTNKRIIYIMGVLKDKEYEQIIAETYAYADQIITLTPPENPRALPAYDLAMAVREFHPRVTDAASVEEAVEMAKLLAGPEDVILAFGSLSYLGKLLDVLENKKVR